MKENIVYLIIIVLLAIVVCQNRQSKFEKYEIKNLDNITVLYDKDNGLAWRNVWCDDKEKIPHCWSLMEYNGAVVPEGEQKRRDNEFKEIVEKTQK